MHADAALELELEPIQCGLGLAGPTVKGYLTQSRPVEYDSAGGGPLTRQRHTPKPAFEIAPEFDQVADLAELKCSPDEHKARFMRSAWERFKLMRGLDPSKVLRFLGKGDALMLIFDQQDSLVRFGMMHKGGVKLHDSLPRSDRPGSPSLQKGLGLYLSDLRLAGKIPVLLYYWANPVDCEEDDDLVIVAYEEPADAPAA